MYQKHRFLQEIHILHIFFIEKQAIRKTHSSSCQYRQREQEMENVVMGIIIGIGIALLAAFQGIVIAALNNEREQLDDEAVCDCKKIKYSSSRLLRKRHSTATTEVRTSIPKASEKAGKVQKTDNIPAHRPQRVRAA